MMTRFEFQRWPVYENALRFVERAYRLSLELPRESTTGLREQLRRASSSIPLNIAEGSARVTSRDKANFFRIARGSVFECVAILDVVQRLELVGANFETMYDDLRSIGKMLSGLIRYVESDEYKRQKGIDRPATPDLN